MHNPIDQQLEDWPEAQYNRGTTTYNPLSDDRFP